MWNNFRLHKDCVNHLRKVALMKAQLLTTLSQFVYYGPVHIWHHLTCVLAHTGGPPSQLTSSVKQQAEWVTLCLVSVKMFVKVPSDSPDHRTSGCNIPRLVKSEKVCRGTPVQACLLCLKCVTSWFHHLHYFNFYIKATSFSWCEMHPGLPLKKVFLYVKKNVVSLCSSNIRLFLYIEQGSEI